MNIHDRNIHRIAIASVEAWSSMNNTKEIIDACVINVKKDENFLSHFIFINRCVF